MPHWPSGPRGATCPPTSPPPPPAHRPGQGGGRGGREKGGLQGEEREGKGVWQVAGVGKCGIRERGGGTGVTEWPRAHAETVMGMGGAAWCAPFGSCPAWCPRTLARVARHSLCAVRSCTGWACQRQHAPNPGPTSTAPSPYSRPPRTKPEFVATSACCLRALRAHLQALRQPDRPLPSCVLLFNNPVPVHARAARVILFCACLHKSGRRGSRRW